MRLWTWQGKGYSLTEGAVDHTCSGYWKTVRGIQEAYGEISWRLGTDQWVWCFLRREDHIDVQGASDVEWELEVPPEHILAFVDDFVWNKILGTKCAPPACVRRQLFQQALNRAPYDAERHDEIRQALEEKWWDSIPADWDKLLVGDPRGAIASATVLIRHPVPNSYVIKPQL